MLEEVSSISIFAGLFMRNGPSPPLPSELRQRFVLIVVGGTIPILGGPFVLWFLSTSPSLSFGTYSNGPATSDFLTFFPPRHLGFTLFFLFMQSTLLSMPPAGGAFSFPLRFRPIFPALGGGGLTLLFPYSRLVLSLSRDLPVAVFLSSELFLCFL